MPIGDARFPSEDTGEVTVFCLYLEMGFGLLTSDIIQGLLQYYGIQPSHLSLNLYLQLANFVHLCEAFLGIDPHFELFLNFFRLKSIPKDEDPKYIGGAGLSSNRKCKSGTSHMSSETPTRTGIRSGSM